MFNPTQRAELTMQFDHVDREIDAAIPQARANSTRPLTAEDMASLLVIARDTLRITRAFAGLIP